MFFPTRPLPAVDIWGSVPLSLASHRRSGSGCSCSRLIVSSFPTRARSPDVCAVVHQTMMAVGFTPIRQHPGLPTVLVFMMTSSSTKSCIIHSARSPIHRWTYPIRRGQSLTHWFPAARRLQHSYRATTRWQTTGNCPALVTHPG